MATVFWDSHGIVCIDYLEKDKTITGAYYASLLDKLKAEIAKKTAAFEEEESAVPSRQRTCSHFGDRHGQNSRTALRIG
ncbi:hypothetical protein P5V15_010179 [Pogonomyrmex californicus]